MIFMLNRMVVVLTRISRPSSESLEFVMFAGVYMHLGKPFLYTFGAAFCRYAWRFQIH